MLLGLAALPLLLAAAEPGDGAASVPRELLEALFVGVGAAGEPELLVGRWPEDLAPALELPEGSRVLGSLVWAESALNAALCPGTTDRVGEELARRLAAAGWRPPEEPKAGGGSRGTARLFCGEGGAYLLLFVGRRNQDATYVRLQYERGGQHSPCGGSWRMAPPTPGD